MTNDNKKIVHDFYDLAFNQHRPREAARLYIGDQYIQHNPFVPDGVPPFVEYFEGYFKEYPKSHVVFSHIVAEADLVVLHLNSKLDAQDRGRAVVDIFRVENGKIIEHWVHAFLTLKDLTFVRQSAALVEVAASLDQN